MPSDSDEQEDRAKVTSAGKEEDGAPCKQFHESELERFFRVNKMFNEDSPTCKIKPSDLATTEALKWYGIIMQGSYGDNKSEAPSWFDLVERLKWNSYENVKGMDRKDARSMFLEGAHKMLAERGFSDENPDKAQTDKDYEICVKEKLSAGFTQAEIDAESENYS